MSVVLGVDIGGSHITAALIDMDDAVVLPGTKKRELVNAKGSASEIIEAWGKVINSSFGNTAMQERKIGIAMPGPFDYKRGISQIKEQEKFNSLYGLNVGEMLADYLGISADCIRFINDAASFLQGEVFGGAAKNFSRVFGITLGTGLGSAVCIDGLASDADLWNAPFKEGIAEDYLSTRWFVNEYLIKTGKAVNGVKELLDVEDTSAVKMIFKKCGENLAEFITPQIEKYSIEAMVVGGNISNAFGLFKASLNQCLLSNNINIVVKRSTLNEDASLVGAASRWGLWPSHSDAHHLIRS